MSYNITFKLNTATMPSVSSCLIELYVHADTLQQAIDLGRKAVVSVILKEGWREVEIELLSAGRA